MALAQCYYRLTFTFRNKNQYYIIKWFKDMKTSNDQQFANIVSEEQEDI